MFTVFLTEMEIRFYNKSTAPIKTRRLVLNTYKYNNNSSTNMALTKNVSKKTEEKK